MKRLSPLGVIALLVLFFALGLIVAHHSSAPAKASTSASVTSSTSASSAPKIVDSSFGSLKVTYVTSHSFGIEPGEQVGGFATCPSGQIAVGGGGYGSSANPAQNIDASEPRKGSGSSVPNEWAAWFNNGTSSPDSFIVYAVCISPAHAVVSSSFIQH
jgi:ABC-type phosphate transport system substrate-binding protein